MRPLVILLALLLCRPLTAAVNPDWTAPLAPIRLADNVFYVGSRDLAAFLITTPAGNILINANLPSSPPQIRHSVEQLGFRWSDTRIFLSSQAHFDHVGGAARILQETHASNQVMAGDAEVMRSGGRADFAFGTAITSTFAPTHVDRLLHDGDRISLGNPAHGGVTLVAHRTAGHTRGCTTFTLQVHLPGDPASQLRNVVIVGGVAPLPSYRLIATPGHPASYPGIAEDFEQTFRTLLALPCDVFLGAHGVYFNLLGKLARYPQLGPATFLDPVGYQRFVTRAQADFQSELATQRNRRPTRQPRSSRP